MPERNDELGRLMTRGGVYYNISGATPSSVLADLAGLVALPEYMDANHLLNAVLEREALMSTAIGDGIALPHPRNPLIDKAEDQFIAIAFLREPIDWRALDGKPVSSLILIISASPKRHLHTLSRVSFLCRDKNFQALLAERASREELIAAVAAVEQAWR